MRPVCGHENVALNRARAGENGRTPSQRLGDIAGMVMRHLRGRSIVKVQGCIFVMVMRHRLQVNQLVRQALDGGLQRSWSRPDPPKCDEHQREQVAANG
jgi:hypothetical protein